MVVNIMPYHPEIEFCLKLQRALVHDPRKGRIFSQWLSFILFDILHIVVPALTLASLMRANHVTVAGLIKIILNFTLFGHVKTFMVLVTKDMELLNRKLLKCFDDQLFNDGRKFQLELKECVDRYNLLKETLDPRILMDGIMHMATGLYFMAMFYCIPGQKLANQVEQLSQNAYLSNWEDHPKVSKDMLIVLSNTQAEFGIRAGGLIPINMPTFMAVCRAIISYCMFFRTIDGAHN
nr:unnamed protein product [Callosobruchus chinensis]